MEKLAPLKLSLDGKEPPAGKQKETLEATAEVEVSPSDGPIDEVDFLGIKSFKSKSPKHKDKADASSYAKITTPSSDKAQRMIITSLPAIDDTYNSNNNRLGVALVFNHKKVKGQPDRNGTEKDGISLQKTLSAYGFDVRLYNELTFEEIMDVVRKTSEEDHSNNDCFVTVIMSHGKDGGRVFAKDMAYPVERLWQPFLGENCQSLINKPKLFFIQACRGMELDKPVTFTAFQPMSRVLDSDAIVEQPTPVTTFAIPNTADLLVMYSTFAGHYSFRRVQDGSWFIQALCDVLDEAFRSPAATEVGTELFRLLTAVNRRVAYEYQSFHKVQEYDQMKEMPNFVSTLTKIFYLKVKRTEHISEQKR